MARPTDAPVSDRSATAELWLLRWLVRYIGLWEAIHLLVNVRALGRLRRGRDTFPAPPPPGGWSEARRATLTRLATIDLVGAAVAIAFVVDYERGGDLWPVLGPVAISSATGSAIVFTVLTRGTGAWTAHPLRYWGLYLSFVPVVALGLLWGLGRSPVGASRRRPGQ